MSGTMLNRNELTRFQLHSNRKCDLHGLKNLHAVLGRDGTCDPKESRLDTKA